MINNLKLRQLRLLVALDSERKLQLAAERLNITQSAASKMLAEIEAVARVPLFERTARGVEPTAYGTILIRGGRSVLADLDRVTNEFAGYRSGELGTVSVGTVAKPSIDLVVDVMQYLGEKLHRVNISLDVSTSPPLITRLLALELDFVVARDPGRRRSRAVRLSRDRGRAGRPAGSRRASAGQSRQRQSGRHGRHAMDHRNRGILHAPGAGAAVLQPGHRAAAAHDQHRDPSPPRLESRRGSMRSCRCRC